MQMFKLDVDCISPIYPHHILTPWLYPKIFKCQKVQAPSSISGSPSKEFENVRNKWNSGLSLRKGGCKCCRVGKESFLSVHRNVTCYVLLSCSHTICIFSWRLHKLHRFSTGKSTCLGGFFRQPCSDVLPQGCGQCVSKLLVSIQDHYH